MPEVVFRGQRCIIQYEGESLHIIVSPHFLPSNIVILPVACIAVWLWAFPSLLPLPNPLFFAVMVIPPIVGGSLMLYLANQFSEHIILANGWLRIEIHISSLPVWSTSYHLETIRDLRIAPETYYWCDPIYRSPRFRTRESQHIWDQGALAFIATRGRRRYVQFASRLNLDAAEIVLDYLWPYYVQYHPELVA